MKTITLRLSPDGRISLPADEAVPILGCRYFLVDETVTLGDSVVWQEQGFKHLKFKEMFFA